MSLAKNPKIGDWIGVKDASLLVRTGKVDIGQRISTALVQIAHEELTVPLDRIVLAPVRTGHAPDEGITSGSNSVEQSGNALRRASATLRKAAEALASLRFGGAADDWFLEAGALHLPGSNHRLDLIDLIASLDLEKPIDPAADSLGRPTGAMPTPAMRGIAKMVRGAFTFVHDLDVPGMLHARVVRPPHARARLVSADVECTRRLDREGLHLVCDGSFLAIAGPREWPVVRAALAFESACTWDTRRGMPEDDIFVKLGKEKAIRLPVVNGTPQNAPVPELLENADYRARFERPYQMHGALAPSAAMAQWDGKTLSIQSHSQGIYPLRASIADSLDLPQSQVDITHVPGSGCYGHNGADDAAFEAALVAMALPDRPVLLKWTREDEHRWEPYAPVMAVEIAANVRNGRIARYSAEAFSDTHRSRPRPGTNRAGPAKLLANRLRETSIGPPKAEPNMGRHAGMHRNLDPVYDFVDKRLVKNLVPNLLHRTSAMRCLGAAANIFALESAMDDLALEQGSDPLDFRRTHLADSRGLAVLERLETHLAICPKPENAGRGLAYAQYKNQMTRVGIGVDLTVNDRAEVYLHHVVIVADAGRVIDAGGLTAQLEGGFIQAVSWALYEEVTWDRDGITSCDWDSYPVIRFDNIPTFKVIIVDRPADPSVGAGEASPGPAIAAIANAIRDATGVTMRRMPFTPDAIRRQAAGTSP